MDIYAVGLVFWSMLQCDLPWGAEEYQNMSEKVFFEKVRCGEGGAEHDGRRGRRMRSALCFVLGCFLGTVPDPWREPCASALALRRMLT